MEKIHTLDMNDYLAIGIATVSFVTVENTLRGAWALDFYFDSGGDRSKIRQKRFQKAFRKSLPELATWLKHHPKTQSLSKSNRENLSSFLDGFLAWRDALFHGRYMKEEDGKIFLSFHDYQSWDAVEEPNSTYGPITNKFTYQELLDVAITNYKFLEALRETLGIRDFSKAGAPVKDND